MSKLKVGIIGVGGIAKLHIPGWHMSEHTELIAGSDINKSILEDWGNTNQINKLYSEKEIIPSEKEITLEGPPIAEIVKEKLIVKIRIKPINPIITSKIEEQNNPSIQLTLSDKDFDYLDSNKKEFVKTVLPIIINENQNILMIRSFVSELKGKLETFRTLNNNEIRKLNDIAFLFHYY